MIVDSNWHRQSKMCYTSLHLYFFAFDVLIRLQSIEVEKLKYQTGWSPPVQRSSRNRVHSWTRRAPRLRAFIGACTIYGRALRPHYPAVFSFKDLDSPFNNSTKIQPRTRRNAMPTGPSRAASSTAMVPVTLWNLKWQSAYPSTYPILCWAGTSSCSSSAMTCETLVCREILGISLTLIRFPEHFYCHSLLSYETIDICTLRDPTIKPTATYGSTARRTCQAVALIHHILSLSLILFSLRLIALCGHPAHPESEFSKIIIYCHELAKWPQPEIWHLHWCGLDPLHPTVSLLSDVDSTVNLVTSTSRIQESL
jgi:hypothetical protein